MDSRAGRRGGHRSSKFHQALIWELYAFAEAELDLSVRHPDGATEREHWEALERQTGITHEKLSCQCPPAVQYLWEYHGRLNLRRTADERGRPNAITNAELQAWARLNGVPLSPFEVEVLDGLEAIFLRHHRATKKAQA